MARRHRCAKCGHLNPADALECEKCAIVFSDGAGKSLSDDDRKRHDSNPNHELCLCGCGKRASVFLGAAALRGGARGYASGHWRFEDVPDRGPTQVGERAIAQAFEILAQKSARERIPGEDDE